MWDEKGLSPLRAFQIPEPTVILRKSSDKADQGCPTKHRPVSLTTVKVQKDRDF